MNWHESSDDWLIYSINKYKKLHTFELFEPVLGLEWCAVNNPEDFSSIISSTCFLYSAVKELQFLDFPENYLACEKFSSRDLFLKSFTSLTDFISVIKFFAGASNIFATSGPDSSDFSIWKYENENFAFYYQFNSDFHIKPYKTLLDVHLGKEKILQGGTLNSIREHDIHRKLITNYNSKPWEDAEKQLASLQYLDDQQILVMTSEGSIYIYDSRTSSQMFAQTYTNNIKSLPTFSLDFKQSSPPLLVSGCCEQRSIAQLFSDGLVSLLDQRHLHEPIGFAKNTFDTERFPVLHPDLYNLLIDGPYVVASGFGNSVNIFQRKDFNKNLVVSPVFVHDHENRVLSVKRHPQEVALYLSSDEQCGLHVWKPFLI